VLSEYYDADILKYAFPILFFNHSCIITPSPLGEGMGWGHPSLAVYDLTPTLS
jgi:hypothetical protein